MNKSFVICWLLKIKEKKKTEKKNKRSVRCHFDRPYRV